MKVSIINYNNNYKIHKNSGIEHKPYLPVIKTDISCDTVYFSGKIPSIVTPTMEDLIKRTKASDILRFNILRLAQYRIPCPVCGHIMLDVNKFNEFESNLSLIIVVLIVLGHI